MNEGRPIHPVVRENMEQVKPKGPHFIITASDTIGGHPSLIKYVAYEPNIADLGRVTRHYASMIFAMPREIAVSYRKGN